MTKDSASALVEERSSQDNLDGGTLQDTSPVSLDDLSTQESNASPSQDNQEQLSKVQLMVAPAGWALWLQMIVRQVVLVESVIVVLCEARKQTRGLDILRPLALAAALLLVGILPFWTRPKLSRAHIARAGLTPAKFTALVMIVSVVILAASLFLFFDYSGHLPKPRYTVYLAVTILITSFLLNETKWASAYFTSNWTPVSKWASSDAFARSQMFLAVVIPNCLVIVFKNPWFYLVSVVWVIIVAAYLAFAMEKALKKLDVDGKLQQTVLDDPDYMPLEWNDKRSYSFFRVQVYEDSKIGFWVYFIMQFL